MKPLFSEEYYKANWDKYLTPVPGNDFIDLEGSLTKTMQKYIEHGIPPVALPVVEKMEAKKLVEMATALVHKELRVIKEIANGEASFGMVTMSQEIKARGDFRRRFEFNCLQLREFKTKYGI